MSQDPSKWSLEYIQQCLMKLGQSTSGTKALLVKRIVNLKNNPLMLDEIVQKRKKSLQFKSRLQVREIPPPEAPWIADSSLYPKVTRAMIKKYQALKRQGSLGQYRKALRMFNSRKEKTVKVIKEGEDIFVKAHIFKSFTPATCWGKRAFTLLDMHQKQN